MDMSEENKQEIKHIDVQDKQELLKCELTPDELLNFGEELANTQQDLNELDGQLANIKNDYKAKMSAKEAEIIRLGNLIRQKYEMRQVDCKVTYDFDEGIATVHRLDTGAFVSKRPMTDSELQRELKLFPERSGAGAGESVTENLITEAVSVIRQSSRASTSLLQRRLGIGYTKAAKIMDVLEERGVISAPKENAPREILIDLNTYDSNAYKS